VVLTYCKTWQELAAKLEASDAQQAEAAEDRKRLEVAPNYLLYYTQIYLLYYLRAQQAEARLLRIAGGWRCSNSIYLIYHTVAELVAASCS
jgi:hypothetical protein